MSHACAACAFTEGIDVAANPNLHLQRARRRIPHARAGERRWGVTRGERAHPAGERRCSLVMDDAKIIPTSPASATAEWDEVRSQ